MIPRALSRKHPRKAMVAEGQRKLSRKKGRVLPLLACLLLSSAMVRVSQNPHLHASNWWFQLAVWAQDTEPAVRTDELGTHSGLEAVIQALSDREAKIVEREREIEERAYAISQAQSRLDQTLEEFAQAEQSLRNILTIAESAAQDDLDQLTRMYETMKPKEAAALFETMDPSFAAGFLGQMSPNAAANVLAGIRPEAAYRISLILAGRNIPNAPAD